MNNGSDDNQRISRRVALSGAALALGAAAKDAAFASAMLIDALVLCAAHLLSGDRHDIVTIGL